MAFSLPLASILTPSPHLMLSPETKTITDELKVEQLTSESSSTNPSVDAVLNDLLNISSTLEELALSEDGLLIVDPKPKKGTHSKIIDDMVQITFKNYNPNEKENPKDNLKYLKGNFGPVGKETPPTSDIITVEGQIPETLNGMMLRNGPDPKFDPEGNYMWMDGDSMIHGIRFKDGKATYVARYTETSRYKQQNEFKKSQFVAFGDLKGKYGMFATGVDSFRTEQEILDKRFGISNAHTGLVYHGGRVMALDDFGLPYVIYVTEGEDLKTLGINIYNGKLKHWLSPHPKIDPVTGDMFNFGSMHTSPYCIYRVISKEGVISDPVSITMQGPSYNHDLCITENYVIFQDLPYVYNIEKMKDEGKWIFTFDDIVKPRYGILPRYATSEDKIKWFQFDDNFFVFHNANAWEVDDDTIVLYCFMMEERKDKNGNSFIAPISFQMFDQDFSESIDGLADFLPAIIPQLFKLTFNMKTKEKKKELIGSTILGDYPKINEKYMGRKTQYVYSSEVNLSNKIPSIIKFDLEEKNGNPKVLKFTTPNSPTTYGGEVVFVPRTDSSTDEDDGYLITFAHQEEEEDSSTGTSFVYVIDAKTMETVAKLKLPSRVPYGFHCIYVTEEGLRNQIQPSTELVQMIT